MAQIAVARSGLFYANASKVLPSKSLRTSLIRCYDTTKAASAKSEENATPTKGNFDSTIAHAAARISPAVANLYAQQGRVADGVMGSGTVIHEDGYILTCAHVVFDKRYAIHADDGEVVIRLRKAEEDVVGQAEEDFVGQVVDAYVDLDIAIIKIDPSSSSLSTAKVGSSSKLRPGDWAIAMGNPLSLQHTITLGIISCAHRTSDELGLPGMPMEYIQTDCAINPGNSGGPLCNVEGEVVGVCVETMHVEKASGVSFAVPVDFISAIIKPFQNCQSPVRPDFGWVVRNVSKKNSRALKKYYPTFPNAEEGVFVQKVIEGSPAYRAGIRAGDVVVDFNLKKVRNIKEMMDAMGERSGAPVTVIVQRAMPGKDDFVRRTITFSEKDAAAPRPRL